MPPDLWDVAPFVVERGAVEHSIFSSVATDRAACSNRLPATCAPPEKSWPHAGLAAQRCGNASICPHVGRRPLPRVGDTQDDGKSSADSSLELRQRNRRRLRLLP